MKRDAGGMDVSGALSSTSASVLQAMKTSQTLSGWSWRQAGDSSWNPCKHQRPATQIHVDLVDAGVIPDPLLGLNEKEVQWVAEKDWEYRVAFDCDAKSFDRNFKTLNFESLDTIAEVRLNGTKILDSDNQFHIHDVDVSSVVRKGQNELTILFKSALLYARKTYGEWEKKRGKMHCWNGEPARLFVRKAQYHFGWDWGPCLITSGPCKPIHFVAYDAVIKDVWVNPQVDEHLNAEVDVTVETHARSNQPSVVSVEVSLEGQVLAKKTTSTSQPLRFSLEQPKLWYPRRYGKQTLYTFKTTLLVNGDALDTVTKEVGIRRLQLVQRELTNAPGKSFFFEINNIPMFSSGSNWIPAHSFSTLITDNDYARWVDIAAEGNQDMLRVWGGGYYEDDRLYRACDEAGIIVWNDFMFGCGQYPCDTDIEASIKREAEDQLRRLRNYCSIVIWAGNNEDYQLAESEKLTWVKDDLSGHYNDTNFPARTLYEGVLPDAVAKMSPGVPYHPGSPWGGKDTRDQTEGDIHAWDVWHGTQEPYQQWSKLAGRFVSEFGMQGMPDIRTVDHFLEGNKAERFPQSRTIEWHNKADSWERRLALYVMENIKLASMGMEDWIYATQLVQAECLAFAYRTFRRNWKGPGQELSAGSLVWQINDCWACTSWAIVDFFRRPKLAYFAVKRESATIAVGTHRTEAGPAKSTVDVWVSNGGVGAFDATLEYQTFDIESGARLSSEKKNVQVRSNGCTEVVEKLEVNASKSVAVLARLTDARGRLLSRAVDWPQPLKHIHFPSRSVEVRTDAGAGLVHITATKPVKGVEMYLDHMRDDIIWDDNGFDVCPGECVTVKVSGLRSGDKVRARFYCEQESAARPALTNGVNGKIAAMNGF